MFPSFLLSLQQDRKFDQSCPRSYSDGPQGGRDTCRQLLPEACVLTEASSLRARSRLPHECQQHLLTRAHSLVAGAGTCINHYIYMTN